MKILLSLIMLLSAAASAQEAAPQVNYQTVKLSDTVYMLKGRGGNVGVSAGADGVYIIDDQLEAISAELIAAIGNISAAPIKFVINTHYHGDHVGGNEAIGKAGSVIVAHDNVHKRMASDQFNHFFKRTTPAYPKGALPVLTFNDRVSLHLNGERATVYHVAHGHTDGDAIVHFEASNVIHMGDIYFKDMYPYIDLDAGGTIHGTIEAVNQALSLADEDSKIIPGHGFIATTGELTAYRDFLLKACGNVKGLIQAGRSLKEIIAAEPTAEWDEALGRVWITPAQFVTFIYNSEKGIDYYTEARD